MQLKRWVDKGDHQAVQVNKKSLDDLLALVDRDIKDAELGSLSSDRRFAVAYNAALNFASYVIRKQGYRVAVKIGHHRITFLVAADILGREAKKPLDYFDLCQPPGRSPNTRARWTPLIFPLIDRSYTKHSKRGCLNEEDSLP